MNPYQVLGVSESATDEEIRSAYIKLVKKYHPDKYQDNPLKNLADEKLKEINQAYDTIQKERAHGGSSGGGSGGGSGGYSGGYSGNYSGNAYSGSGTYSGGYSQSSGQTGYAGYTGEYADQFRRVRELLNNNSVAQARSMLDMIPIRNAEWHYLYGVALFRTGQYSNARSHLEMAAQMDPGNTEYRNAFNSTAARGTRTYHTYDNADRGSGQSSLSSFCSCCSTLWCLDSCCECMGSDLCRCM